METSASTIALLIEIRDAIGGINDRLDGSGGSINQRLHGLESTINRRLGAVEGGLRELAEQQRSFARFYEKLYFAG